MLSPLSKILPTETRRCFFSTTSSASSRTRFMYSSKPTMRPSTHASVFSYIQICTRALVCKKRKIKFCRARARAREGSVDRSRTPTISISISISLPSARTRPLSLSLSLARARRRARGRRLVRTSRARIVRAFARAARARPPSHLGRVDSRARARTYDRLRHDSLHFGRHGASFDASARSRDSRGCFLSSLVVARAGSFASRDAH